MYRLRAVEEYFNTQCSLQLYGSSILLIYDADPASPIKVDLRMIDFSHVFSEVGVRDENYLVGVRYLRGILDRLLAQSLKSSTSSSPAAALASPLSTTAADCST